jgi:flagellar basal-body rod modification protein FlgD
MSAISPVSTLIQTPQNSRIPAKTMDQNDFLKVLLTQLTNQDPLKPQDGNAMLEQMGQIQNIQSMLAMQDNINQSRRDGQMTLGQSLIGKTVKVFNEANEPYTGIVKEVRVEGKNVVLGMDNGASYNISNLSAVLATPSVTP